jgi:hypothetical protein
MVHSRADNTINIVGTKKNIEFSTLLFNSSQYNGRAQKTLVFSMRPGSAVCQGQCRRLFNQIILGMHFRSSARAKQITFPRCSRLARFILLLSIYGRPILPLFYTLSLSCALSLSLLSLLSLSLSLSLCVCLSLSPLSLSLSLSLLMRASAPSASARVLQQSLAESARREREKKSSRAPVLQLWERERDLEYLVCRKESFCAD